MTAAYWELARAFYEVSGEELTAAKFETMDRLGEFEMRGPRPTWRCDGYQFVYCRPRALLACLYEIEGLTWIAALDSGRTNWTVRFKPEEAAWN